MNRVLEPEVMDTAEEADAYDAMDHTGPNRSFVERLALLGARGRALDVGCGPGHVALMVLDELESVTEVVGVDLSTNMLRHAQRHRAASPHRDRLRFELGDAKGLPFQDGSFQTVFSNTILHHIPDPVPFLAEVWRVLAPGGTLLVRDLFRPADEATVAQLVAQHAAEAAPDQRELFRASLCAAFTPGELRRLAARAGLEDAEVTVDSDRHVSLQRPSAG